MQRKDSFSSLNSVTAIANASLVVDVIAKEGLVPFEYTLWTTNYHTWSKAYLEVRDAETGEAAARLTLTGDRDREPHCTIVQRYP